jgi:hypothetical protein
MRLDRLLYQWWKDATRDNDEDPKAFRRACRATRQLLRILDQRNRIQGLNR